MALYPSFCHSLVTVKIDHSKSIHKLQYAIGWRQTTTSLRKIDAEIFGRQNGGIRDMGSAHWRFLGGSRAIIQQISQRSVLNRKSLTVNASWLPSSQVAASVFTLGTIAVLPFYTLMVVAPKAEATKKVMESSLPYIVLGLLYGYLLYLSWTPDTIRLMFASKYWLPELPGIAKMFSSEMTLASAWIHLLVVDLFAARQVFTDGLKNDIETRHSVSLCLLFCPIGIISHFLTKAVTSNVDKSRSRIH